MFCSFKLVDAVGFLLAIEYCVKAFMNQLLIELPDDDVEDIDDDEDENSDEASADFGE